MGNYHFKKRCQLKENGIVLIHTCVIIPEVEFWKYGLSTPYNKRHIENCASWLFKMSMFEMKSQNCDFPSELDNAS